VFSLDKSLSWMSFALRELGYVVRTMFLFPLRYISEADLLEAIQSATNKSEYLLIASGTRRAVAAHKPPQDFPFRLCPQPHAIYGRPKLFSVAGEKRT